MFKKFIDKFGVNYVILGCTEFPLLINYMLDFCEKNKFYDPLELTLKKLKHEMI